MFIHNKCFDNTWLRAQLQDRVITYVAEQIGVHKNSLYRFKNGSTGLAFQSTLKLIQYLNKENDNSRKYNDDDE